MLRVKEFKYLGSTVQEIVTCEREIKRRVQAGWNGWRRVLRVICNRRLPARVKGKVYSSDHQWCMDLQRWQSQRNK